MLSKRKALIGYGVYTAGKPFAKRAIRRKGRPVKQPRTRKVLAMVAAGAAAVLGVLLFWRRRRSGSDQATEA